MDKISIDYQEFYTERESISVQWRGDGIQNRAIGRVWTLNLICENSSERTTLLGTIAIGLLNIIMPDGEQFDGVVFLEEDSWMRFPTRIGIRIEEIT